MAEYLTKKERKKEELKAKEQRFKREIFSPLKNFCTKFCNGIDTTIDCSELIKKIKNSGLASSLSEAEEKVERYLTEKEMKMVGKYSPRMRFDRVSSEDGKEKIRISYWEWDL